jgi:hypothetical protein
MARGLAKDEPLAGELLPGEGLGRAPLAWMATCVIATRQDQ